jgi:hypothetical protein
MKGQPIKILIAVLMSLCSGFLIYFMGSLLFFPAAGIHGANQLPTLGMQLLFDGWIASSYGLLQAPTLGIILLFGGWIASSYGLLQGAQTTSKVLARGFLLGATEWLLMVGVGFISASKIIDLSRSQLEMSVASSGIFAAVTGGASLFMVLVCLAGYAIVHFWRREMKPEQPAPSSPIDPSL